ncbi:MAG: ribosome silencing factor [Oscillospiraceae bacterium]|nr:ribosome silencing factor [Oscillospiraceae bacterium]
MQSKELAIRITQVLDKKKADSLKVLGIEDLTVLTDYFVIATGTSTTHVKALAEEVEFQMGQQGVPVLRSEGWDTQRWILLDFGGVIVHVFCPDARNYYDLEHLWADGTPLDLSEFLVEPDAAPAE